MVGCLSQEIVQFAGIDVSVVDNFHLYAVEQIFAIGNMFHGTACRQHKQRQECRSHTAAVLEHQAQFIQVS